MRGDVHARRVALFAVGALTAAVVVYYTIPIYGDAHGDWVAVRAGVFGCGLVALAALFLREVEGALRDPSTLRRRTQILFVAVCLTLVFFALTYYAMARGSPGAFDGIRTKTDALYFSVTVLSTVGFGDVHAVSQWARAIVTVQMAFDVLFIVTTVSVLRGGGRLSASPGAPATPIPPATPGTPIPPGSGPPGAGSETA